MSPTLPRKLHVWYSIPQNNTLRIYPKAGPDHTHVYLSHTSIWVPLQMRPPPPPPPSSPASGGTQRDRKCTQVSLKAKQML